MLLLPLLSLSLLSSLVHGASVPRTCTSKPRFNWPHTTDLLVFGDSYSFVQGTLGHAKSTFIGDLFDYAFTPEELMSDEIVPKKTSSDGSNWVEFLTGCYSGRPADCSPHKLWDFAFSGADISGAILNRHHNFTLQLVDSVNQWATYAADVLNLQSKRTLVGWWIGINDTKDSLEFTNITDWRAYWEIEMDALFSSVELVYSKGLQNHLFFNVPPEERSPTYTAWPGHPTLAAVLKGHIEIYNEVLVERVRRFGREHADANVFVFDAHGWWNGVLDNYEEYGFKNITGYCTCTDDTYFWYNKLHPVEKVHKLLATSVKEKLLEWSEGYSMQKLLPKALPLVGIRPRSKTEA